MTLSVFYKSCKDTKNRTENRVSEFAEDEDKPNFFFKKFA